jgi:transcription-repair coupling factor (superfamily II helicase)
LPFRREEEAFRDTFKYIHTEDQMNAIDEIYADMEREMPMDRLLS